ncbi:hypothetical protein MTP99_007350 [Tenebrio molitor]|nr:hypothetical protein MTP99_007350 [Tenebrio molitor]
MSRGTKLVALCKQTAATVPTTIINSPTVTSTTSMNNFWNTPKKINWFCNRPMSPVPTPTQLEDSCTLLNSETGIFPNNDPQRNRKIIFLQMKVMTHYQIRFIIQVKVTRYIRLVKDDTILNDPQAIVDAFADILVQAFVSSNLNSGSNSDPICVRTNVNCLNGLGVDENIVLSAIRRLKSTMTADPFFVIKDCAENSSQSSYEGFCTRRRAVGSPKPFFSPVDPSLLEPDHRQGGPPVDNMEGAPGLNDENT